jgi:hypothetical protein
MMIIQPSAMEGERSHLPPFADESQYLGTKILRNRGGDRDGAGSDHLQTVGQNRVLAVAILPALRGSGRDGLPATVEGDGSGS